MALLFLDIETTGLDPFTCELVTLQLMTASGRSLILKDPKTLESLRHKLENNLIVGQNLKFDSKFLKHKYGITLYNVYDTMLAEIAISGGELAGRKGASLKDLALKYCGVTLDKSEQCGFKKGEALTAEQENYAVNDLKHLPQIMQQQQAKIKLLGLEQVIDTEMRALPAVVWLELSGMPIDLNKANEIKAKLVEQRENSLQILEKEFKPYTVNLNSPKQLKEALNRLQIPVTKTSSEELARFHGPVIEALKTFKEAEKLLNTFVEKIPEYVNSETGRIHSNFSQYGTKSGRFTSSSPNLQQQPSKFTEWRSIYQAMPGNKIVTADYSQIELRILGQVSHDKEFIDAYNTGVDLHKLTASKVFKIPLEEVTKQQRSISKTVNFGIAYGMWIDGLMGNLTKAGIKTEKEEAEQIIKGFYKAYPAVTKYLYDVSQEGLIKREIRNKAGRLMKFDRPKDAREEGSIKSGNLKTCLYKVCVRIWSKMQWVSFS
jgi:DNA polymerase I-like protein with 3'-5' exonuclease and polymerase domains